MKAAVIQKVEKKEGRALPRSACRSIYMSQSLCWVLIAKDHPVATFKSPGLVVAGWSKPATYTRRPDNRKLRMRSGRVPRLTTKVSK